MRRWVAAWLAVVRRVGARGPAVCVGARARLPGRGALAHRCAAANVVSERDEYLVGAAKCAAATAKGAACGCCRRWRARRDAREDSAVAHAKAKERCARVAAPTSDRVAVYSVSSGGYDLGRGAFNGTLREAGVDYLLFCDPCPRSLPAPWTAVPLPSSFDARRKNASSSPKKDDAGCSGVSVGGFADYGTCASRDVKVRPHAYGALRRYAASLYVDANVRVHGEVRDLLVAARNRDLQLFTFPRSTAAEADWVVGYLKRALRLGGDDAAALRRKVVRQAKAYGDRTRTAYGKVLARTHGAASCYFGERWWRELKAGVPRDQLSLLWAADAAKREAGLKWAPLNSGPGERRCSCAADDAAFQARFRHLGVQGRGARSPYASSKQPPLLPAG